MRWHTPLLMRQLCVLCLVSESVLGNPKLFFLEARVFGESHCGTCPGFSSYPADVVYLPVCRGVQCGYLLST